MSDTVKYFTPSIEDIREKFRLEAIKVAQIVDNLRDDINYNGDRPGIVGISGYPSNSSELEWLITLGMLQCNIENLSHTLKDLKVYGFK